MEKVFLRVELYLDIDYFIRLVDVNGYVMINIKFKSVKDLWDGIINVIIGKEDRKLDKYFEVCFCMCVLLVFFLFFVFLYLVNVYLRI